MVLDATNLDYTALNNALRDAAAIRIDHCLGQRFLGAGMSGKQITIYGTPGNALGAYLNGAEITVHGNTQDAVGDTMNDGRIVIHGNVGDAAGYAMRGGKIFVKGNAGYRTGIHMKAYKEKNPILVIGGCAGSFLGEYQAGGTIVVLGLQDSSRSIVSNFPGAGMHGGKMFLRSDCKGLRFPRQVSTHPATPEDILELKPILEEYCGCFDLDAEALLRDTYTVVIPDSQNPYRQMYVTN